MNSRLKKYLEILDQNSEELRERFYVKEIGIFGSAAHGSMNKKSDVDVLVEFLEPVGFFHFIRLENFLKKLFKRKVDLATVGALKPLIKRDILRDVVYA